MTAEKTAAASVYISGFCGARAHERCRGDYRTAVCTCECHDEVAEPQPEPEPEPESVALGTATPPPFPYFGGKTRADGGTGQGQRTRWRCPVCHSARWVSVWLSGTRLAQCASCDKVTALPTVTAAPPVPDEETRDAVADWLADRCFDADDRAALLGDADDLLSVLAARTVTSPKAAPNDDRLRRRVTALAEAWERQAAMLVGRISRTDAADRLRRALADTDEEGQA